MLWRKNRAKARQAMEKPLETATDLADKSLVIGWGGVAFLVAAAVVGTAVTYAMARARKNRKAAKGGGSSES